MINNHALMSDTNVHEIISEIINHPEISRSEISHSTSSFTTSIIFHPRCRSPAKNVEKKKFVSASKKEQQMIQSSAAP